MTVYLEDYGKVTASKEVLNILSMVFQDSADYHASKNNMAHKELYERISFDIYEELKKLGFYN